MRSFTIRLHLIPFVGCVVCATFIGCVAFDPAVQSTVEDLNERPSVAILPFGFDLEITKLSDMKTANEMLSPEEESKQVAEALREIQREARWLLLSRLAAGRGFQFVPSPGCRSRRRREYLGLWESSLAVDARRNDDGHDGGEHCARPRDGMESDRHRGQSWLRTPDEYPSVVWRRLFVRDLIPSRAG